MKNRSAYYLFGIKFLQVTRFRLAILLFLSLTITSSIAFAVWDNASDNDDNIIIIGDGANLDVVKVLRAPSNGERLIPMKAFKGSNDVYYYQYEYDIIFNKDGSLVINIIDIMTDSELENLSEHFNFFISLDETDFYSNQDTLTIMLTEGNAYYNEVLEVFNFKVFITVTMNEPDSLSAKEALANQALNFSVHFQALQPNA
ncbi:hypothetical protein [Liberiplasma polymorphum]|uniref:hypothetical protein n=1 Tax=Liberiplasma polymorphum TaxID=3374570 RepID=UPI003775FDA5